MWSKLGPFDLQAQANAYHQQKGSWPQLYPDNAIGVNQAALGLTSFEIANFQNRTGLGITGANGGISRNQFSKLDTINRIYEVSSIKTRTYYPWTGVNYKFKTD